ncbi:MAG: hypothetical protein FJY29_13760 [Betaproteobacteria bacterium]|nr:hypothetical protein [Betaproteobacteria bacterium]
MKVSIIRVALAFVTAIAVQELPAARTAASASDMTFGGQPIAILADASELKIQTNRISGSGKVEFKENMGRLGQNTSHSVSFALSDGGKIVLSAYAQTGLSKGINFEFARAGKTLKVTLMKEGAAPQDASAQFTSINASRVIDLQIDVHNSESPAHILIWNGLEKEFHEDNALFNSAATNTAVAQGEGKMRGFALNNAVLFKATVSKPKLDHGHDHDHDHDH